MKAKGFLLKKLNGNIEVGLLVICSSALNQFLNINESQILNRASVYFSIVIIAFLILFNLKIYYMIKIHDRKLSSPSSSRTIVLSILDKLDVHHKPK